MRTDRRALSQILINLANNAIKFTEQGHGAAASCGSGSETAIHRSRFRVTDTGIGIRPEDQDRLFQAFTRWTPRGRVATKAPGWACT